MTTPLTVHLPFNRDILGAEFSPAKRGDKPDQHRGHWILVQGQNLLVAPDGDELPAAHRRLPRLPLDGVAPFWLGTYRDEPCWVVPIAAERDRRRPGSRARR